MLYDDEPIGGLTVNAFTDGSVSIWDDGQWVTLTPSETIELHHLLGRVIAATTN